MGAALAEALEGIAGRLSVADTPEGVENAVNELLALAKGQRAPAGYEWRAVAAEDNGNPEEFSPWDLREDEARRELARYLGPDYADPPYIVGWVERRLVVRPERMP